MPSTFEKIANEYTACLDTEMELSIGMDPDAKSSGRIDPTDILNDWGLFTCKSKEAVTIVSYDQVPAHNGQVPSSRSQQLDTLALPSSRLATFGEIEHNYSTVEYRTESAVELKLPSAVAGRLNELDAMEVLSGFGIFTQKVKRAELEVWINFAQLGKNTGDVEHNYRSEVYTQEHDVLINLPSISSCSGWVEREYLAHDEQEWTNPASQQAKRIIVSLSEQQRNYSDQLDSSEEDEDEEVVMFGPSSLMSVQELNSSKNKNFGETNNAPAEYKQVDCKGPPPSERPKQQKTKKSETYQLRVPHINLGQSLKYGYAPIEDHLAPSSSDNSTDANDDPLNKLPRGRKFYVSTQGEQH